MDEHANRMLAYMAQIADERIEFKAGGESRLVSYSDSDWAVSHSTTGFCVMFGRAVVSYGSIAFRYRPPRRRSSRHRTRRQ
eukprot:869791-Pleurochrysis_carterae.AAC.1